MSLATAYAVKRRSHRGVEKCIEHGAEGCEMCHGGKMAEGGEVKKAEPFDEIVGSIMKNRYSKGGEVANDTGEGAFTDEMPNEFDELVLEDDLSEHYTDKNSGDEVGDHHLDEEDHDVVSSVMNSRKKKDRMPRPA